MLTKKALEDYQNIQPEIEELNRRLAMKKNTVQKNDTGILLELATQKREVEIFIGGLPTSRQRRLMRLRIFEGMTWHEVACRLSSQDTSGSTRTLYYRILKENKIV